MGSLLLGIDRINELEFQEKLEGKVALLAHSASFNGQLNHSAEVLSELLGNRLIKLFGSTWFCHGRSRQYGGN